MGWDWVGIGLDGSLGLVEYRAPYGANNHGNVGNRGNIDNFGNVGNVVMVNLFDVKHGSPNRIIFLKTYICNPGLFGHSYDTLY